LFQWQAYQGSLAAFAKINQADRETRANRHAATTRYAFIDPFFIKVGQVTYVGFGNEY
jgi:hypothetical protein